MSVTFTPSESTKTVDYRDCASDITVMQCFPSLAQPTERIFQLTVQCSSEGYMILYLSADPRERAIYIFIACRLEYSRQDTTYIASACTALLHLGTYKPVDTYTLVAGSKGICTPSSLAP